MTWDRRRLSVDRKKFDAARDAGDFDANPYFPILEGVRDGVISLIQVFQAPPGDPTNVAEAWEIERPNTVIEIGDDLETSYGPHSFDLPSLEKAIRQIDRNGGGIILQIAQFRPDVMASVAIGAALGRTTMIVEARAEKEIEWYKWLRGRQRNDRPGILLITEKREAN